MAIALPEEERLRMILEIKNHGWACEVLSKEHGGNINEVFDTDPVYVYRDEHDQLGSMSYGNAIYYLEVQDVLSACRDILKSRSTTQEDAPEMQS